MVIDSIHRYEGIGYTERFDTAPGGLRSEQTGRVHRANALEVEHVVSLGSPTEDSSPILLFALRSRVDGARGTWVVSRDALSRDAQRLVAQLAGADPQRTWTRRVPQGGAGAGEFVLEGAMVGVIGASLVALWFLLVDATLREPLFTPALLADRLFGQDSGTHALTIDLARVSAVAALHGGLFVLFGIGVAWIVSRHVLNPSLSSLALALFGALEGGFLFVSELAFPGVASGIGHGTVLVGNALAAAGMAAYLRRSRPHPAHPEAAPSVTLEHGEP
jgi:hypothetical protein